MGLVLAGAALIGAYIAYQRLIHYDRCAVEHLPADTAFAARLDLQQVVLFEPVRRYLLPVIDKLPVSGASISAPLPDRLTRLRQSAGLNLGLDMREILVAMVAPTGGWVVVVGGLFEERRVDAIEELIRAEGVTGLTRSDDILIFDPWGAALGQAEDGALIMASSPAVLASALPSTPRYRELGLPRDGAGGIFFAPDQVRRWLGSAAWLGGDWWTKLRRAGVTVELDAALVLAGHLEVREASDLDAVSNEVEQWLQTYHSISRFVPKADFGGERAVLARARTVKATETLLILSSSWERAEFEHAIRSLAAWLERQLGEPSSGKR
jgi:hypothetical protein